MLEEAAPAGEAVTEAAPAGEGETETALSGEAETEAAFAGEEETEADTAGVMEGVTSLGVPNALAERDAVGLGSDVKKLAYVSKANP